MITGRCECSRVQYEVDAEITDLGHCHCSQCWRLHGAAFVTFAGIPRDKFRYVAGESDLKSYVSSEDNARIFCGVCGSNILVDCKSEPEALYIAMGTVNGDPACPSASHQFVGSKAAWYKISDDLPQHEEWEDE